MRIAERELVLLLPALLLVWCYCRHTRRQVTGTVGAGMFELHVDGSYFVFDRIRSLDCNATVLVCWVWGTEVLRNPHYSIRGVCIRNKNQFLMALQPKKEVLFLVGDAARMLLLAAAWQMICSNKPTSTSSSTSCST